MMMMMKNKAPKGHHVISFCSYPGLFSHSQHIPRIEAKTESIACKEDHLTFKNLKSGIVKSYLGEGIAQSKSCISFPVV